MVLWKRCVTYAVVATVQLPWIDCRFNCFVLGSSLTFLFCELVEEYYSRRFG